MSWFLFTWELQNTRLFTDSSCNRSVQEHSPTVHGEGTWSAVFPIFTFWLSWLSCIYNRNNKKNHQPFTLLMDIRYFPNTGESWTPALLILLLGSTKPATLQNCLKCHQGRGCFSMGRNWGSCLCFQTGGDTLLLPQSLQHLQHPRWLQPEFHTLGISFEKCNFLDTIPSYWPFW